MVLEREFTETEKKKLEHLDLLERIGIGARLVFKYDKHSTPAPGELYDQLFPLVDRFNELHEELMDEPSPYLELKGDLVILRERYDNA